MTLGILVTTIGVASPVSAAPWLMPAVRDMTLKKAIKEVEESTGVADLKFAVQDRKNGQEVHNYTNWVVCAQWPPAGEPISQKTKRVTLLVKRFNQQRCTS